MLNKLVYRTISKTGAVLLACLLIAACDSTTDDDPENTKPDNSSGIASLCAALQDCRDQNEAERQACVVDVSATGSLASIAGCDAEFASIITCGNATKSCEGGNFGTDCDAERDAFEDCQDAAETPIGDEPAASTEATAWCAAVAECKTISELERWSCLIHFDRDVATAEAYGCAAEAGTYATCAATKQSCEGGEITLDSSCFDALSAMGECIEAASSSPPE